MKIEKTVSLVFTEFEVKEALLRLLECEMNDLVFNDPKYQRLQKLLDLAKDENTMLDFVDGQYYLVVDGIAETEEF